MRLAAVTASGGCQVFNQQKPPADGDKKKVSVTWAFSSFLESMRALANTEHKHNSLGFLRRHSPDMTLKEYKSLLDKLQINQRDIAQMYVAPELTPQVMQQLCAYCISFVHVRRDIVSIYSEIMNAKTPKLEVLEGYGRRLQLMVGQLKKDRELHTRTANAMASGDIAPAEVLDSLQVGMLAEISTFAALMLAHCSISNHHFKDTIVRLSRAQTDLRTWKQCFSDASASAVETSNTVRSHFQILYERSIAPFFFPKIACKQNLDFRCVLISDPSTLGAGAKTRLESRIKKFTPHCIFRCPRSSQCCRACTATHTFQ